MPSCPSAETRAAGRAAGGRLGAGTAGPRELLSGLDSLDLTCKVPAPAVLLDDLAAKKAEAQTDARRAVVLPVGEDFLRVAASGMGAWWPYRLEHRFGMLGVGESANRPAWRVSVAAEALHVESPARVVAFWRGVIEALTGSPVVLMVSRLDVHADFAGLGIGEADRAAFVCRSRRQSVEFEGGELETLYLGKGGAVSLRIYDKLAEIKAKGQGEYLLPVYVEAGWREGDSVQRVEAQVRREALRELGVMTVEDALARAGAVYGYVVGKWVRLVEPGTASRRERAKPDARWQAVQAASIAAGIDPSRRLVAEASAPALDVIVSNVAGWAVRAGEALGVADFATAWRQLGLLVGGYFEDKGRDFAAEVQARRLELGPVA